MLLDALDRDSIRSVGLGNVNGRLLPVPRRGGLRRRGRRTGREACRPEALRRARLVRVRRPRLVVSSLRPEPAPLLGALSRRVGRRRRLRGHLPQHEPVHLPGQPTVQPRARGHPRPGHGGGDVPQPAHRPIPPAARVRPEHLLDRRIRFPVFRADPSSGRKRCARRVRTVTATSRPVEARVGGHVEGSGADVREGRRVEAHALYPSSTTRAVAVVDREVGPGPVVVAESAVERGVHEEGVAGVALEVRPPLDLLRPPRRRSRRRRGTGSSDRSRAEARRARSSAGSSASSSAPVASTGSSASPRVGRTRSSIPPGSGARAVSVPARPLAASFSVPSPPSTTTTSVPSLAAPWARRVAWPRRLVSATVDVVVGGQRLLDDDPRAGGDRRGGRVHQQEELQRLGGYKHADLLPRRVGTQNPAMNVVVCVKQIPDPADPGKLDPEHQDPHARGQAHPRRVRLVRRRDGAAARRHRGRRRGHPRLDGPQQRGQRPAHRPRHGCGQGHPHLSDAALQGSDALGTAKVLAAAIKRAEPDLIITATESTDGYTGTMPEQIAELLGLPSVTFAKHIEIADGKVKVQRQTEAGYDEVEVPAARARHGDRRRGRAAVPVVQGDHGGQEQAGRRGDGRRPRCRRRRRSAGPGRASRSPTSLQPPNARRARPHAGCRQRLAAEVPVVGTAVVEGERAGGSASTTVNTKIGTRRPLAEKVLLRALGRPKPW